MSGYDETATIMKRICSTLQLDTLARWDYLYLTIAEEKMNWAFSRGFTRKLLNSWGTVFQYFGHFWVIT